MVDLGHLRVTSDLKFNVPSVRVNSIRHATVRHVYILVFTWYECGISDWNPA